MYVGSIRTMYRVLAEEAELIERRSQRQPHVHAKPSLTARGPNEVWTGDITKLATERKNVLFMTYIIIALSSRYVGGWVVASKECQHLAAQLFSETIAPRTERDGHPELVRIMVAAVTPIRNAERVPVAVDETGMRDRETTAAIAVGERERDGSESSREEAPSIALRSVAERPPPPPMFLVSPALRPFDRLQLGYGATMSTPTVLTPGSVFARDYSIVRPLSEGGMGAVYVVQQLSTGAQRALKLMHPQLVREPRQRARFEQEARVGAQIESEHVVSVLGSGIDDASGLPWLVMELLSGQDLARAIAERGALPIGDVRDIFAQLTHAVAAAHRVGIVHRDLKPENIFLAVSHREGQTRLVKVLDFGIAKVVAEAKATATQALGTPIWMAPEQTEASRSITPAADVWALGLIAFRMLTGKHFWISANSDEATATMVLREVVIDAIVPASQRARDYGLASLLPQGFDDWFARCVVRDPTQRFPDAGAARIAFGHLFEAGHVGPISASQAVPMPSSGAVAAITSPGPSASGPSVFVVKCGFRSSRWAVARSYVRGPRSLRG